MPSLSIKSRATVGVFITWLALLLLVVVRQVVPACSLTALSVALLYSLPLLIPLPGLLRGNRHTHTWATLCILPYFIVGITEVVANPAARTWAIALLGASLLCFFALIGFLRVTQRAVSDAF